ncbi:MAG: HAMP domain-containing histidine kinase, partial [Chloroflexi bacterium]|nr:HAMP domain-containing histidine kinase [Chloroflexota bacterium]
AAAGQAPVSFIVGAAVEPGRAGRAPVGGARGRVAEATGSGNRYASLPIPSAGDVVLGFEFRRAADAERVADRLPPTLARHAAVALALVTEQLATERELAALRAREAERTTFVSTVAHELRTPLTGLRGYLELILDGKVSDPAVERDFLERGRSIVGSMGELVGDLLELSRLESGTLGLELEPFSVADAGQHVAAGLLPIAIERGVHLTTNLPPRLRVALGDRRRVEQILTNLAANGLKFTPSGGTVEIAARIDGQVAILTIRDDGAGIPADDRGRIFERFHRMAGHERITGTGLGLPIARDLARQMDGDLNVASLPGAGSAFVLVLPGAAGAAPEVTTAALQRALVLEDSALAERALRRAFTEQDGGDDRDDDRDDDGSGHDGHGTRGTEPGRRTGSARLRALPGSRERSSTSV